jgi:hypothetical protein
MATQAGVQFSGNRGLGGRPSLRSLEVGTVFSLNPGKFPRTPLRWMQELVNRANEAATVLHHSAVYVRTASERSASCL